jgi:starch-binding outer membrane protein, SusD/RagB family
MRAGDLAGMTANLNIVRAIRGAPAVPVPPSQAIAIDLLFKDRAYALWLTSHRLGDLRRLIRDYDRKEYEVFPTGEYPKGGNYGTDVSFPIPVDTQFNPSGLACFGVIQ